MSNGTGSVGQSRWDANATAGPLARAAVHARRLETPHVDERHVLLMLLSSTQATIARTVLLELGVTRERIERAGAEDGEEAFDGWVASTPWSRELFGFAAGLALAGGADAVADDHLLLAMCFTGRPDRLVELGLHPDEAVERMAARGCTVPPLLPPAYEPPPAGPWQEHQMSPETANALVPAMFERFGAGYAWGVNTEPDGTVVVSSTEALDVRALIDELGLSASVQVRERSERGERRATV